MRHWAVNIWPFDFSSGLMDEIPEPAHVLDNCVVPQIIPRFEPTVALASGVEKA